MPERDIIESCASDDLCGGIANEGLAPPGDDARHGGALSRRSNAPAWCTLSENTSPSAAVGASAR